MHGTEDDGATEADGGAPVSGLPVGAASGVVLAAGAGRRFGGPKALVPGWLAGRVEALRHGGCADVVVVLGAEAHRARRLVPPEARVVVCAAWASGMGASLRCGLDALAQGGAALAVVALVDTPGMTAAAVRRVLRRATSSAALVRATYGGEPGHPVVIGRQHWAAAGARAVGDRGARDLLSERGYETVECGDVADGRDVDHGPGGG